MENVVKTVKDDARMMGCVLCIVGAGIALAPYVALGFSCPVPWGVEVAVTGAGSFILATGMVEVMKPVILIYRDYFFRKKDGQEPTSE